MTTNVKQNGTDYAEMEPIVPIRTNYNETTMDVGQNGT
jgi:hypothetical protein